MNKAKVMIRYKSGAEIIVRTSSFKIEKNGLGELKITWAEDTTPRPLMLGVDEIESVWEL